MVRVIRINLAVLNKKPVLIIFMVTFAVGIRTTVFTFEVAIVPFKSFTTITGIVVIAIFDHNLNLESVLHFVYLKYLNLWIFFFTVYVFFVWVVDSD